MDSKNMNEPNTSIEKKNLQTEENFKDLKQYQDYLTDKIHTYADYFSYSRSDNVQEYLDYLVVAIFLIFKQYYPNLSIYIPYRNKANTSFLNNLNKEIVSQEGLLDDNKIITDINGITIVLDHINRTVGINPDYNYRSNPTINNLLKQSNDLLNYVEEIEPSIKELLTKKQYLQYKKDFLTKIIEVNFKGFTLERIPSYSSELQNVNDALDYFEDIGAYASPEEITELNILLNELRSKLYDKAYYTLLPEAFENVMKDSLISTKLHAAYEFVKDSQKPNGFAANYYMIKTPFGNIEVQLQSAKRYYEAKKGSAAHSSIPGKNLNIKNLFELKNPNDEKPLNYYLDILDATPVTKTQYVDLNSDTDSQQYKEAMRIKELMTHIKLKEYYTYKINNNTSESEKIPMPQHIYNISTSSSPYMAMCSSAHTNFRNVYVTHRSRISAYSEVLRKRDSLSCLGDMVVGCLEDYLKSNQFNSTTHHNRDNTLTYVTENTPEVSMQSIIQYISRLDKIIARQSNSIIKKSQNDNTR